MKKGSEKVDMPLYVKVEGVAYMNGDVAHGLILALSKIQTISAHMQSKRSSDVNRIASDALAKFQGDE